MSYPFVMLLCFALCLKENMFWILCSEHRLIPLHCLAVVLDWLLSLSRYNFEVELREKELREKGQRYNKIFFIHLFSQLPFRDMIERVKRWKYIS